MSEAVIVEIRAGEGGKHSQILVSKMAGIYEKYGKLECL